MQRRAGQGNQRDDVPACQAQRSGLGSLQSIRAGRIRIQPAVRTAPDEALSDRRCGAQQCGQRPIGRHAAALAPAAMSGRSATSIRSRDAAHRPIHRPGIVVADVGDLMSQNAGDLAAGHAAQQPLGQDDRSAFGARAA